MQSKNKTMCRLQTKSKKLWPVTVNILILLALSCCSSARNTSSGADNLAKVKENAVTEDKLMSGVRSSVFGVDLTNVHFITRDQGSLYRGMRIRNESDLNQLKEQTGLTDVLIFRAASKDVGITAETELLAKGGITPEHVTHIAFRWSDIPSFREACEQTMDAFALMEKIRHQTGRSLYIHCTVGEDRTGYLAGIYRIVYQDWSEAHAFQDEMCERGYAEGNPAKPAKVNQLVHENITPVFLKMVNLFERNILRPGVFDKSVCLSDPLTTDNKFKSKYDALLKSHHCKVSSNAIYNFSEY